MKLRKLWMLGIASLLGLSLVGCGSSNKLELKKETFVVEYGETISMDAKTYLAKDTDKDVLKDAQVLIKLNKMTPTPIGTYDATIKYKDESIKFKVKVKDTKKPEFIDFKDKIEVEQGFNGDITTMFKSHDLSEVKITVDTKNVDFNKLGEYKVKVTAIDHYKNKTTKETIIVVKEKQDAAVENAVAETTGGANNNNNTNSGSNTPTPPPSSGTPGGNTNTGGNTPPPSAPYIVDDGRLYYKYVPGGDATLTMNSPIFRTEQEAYNWALTQGPWTNATHGFGTCGITYSDGTEKYSVYWYSGQQ